MSSFECDLPSDPFFDENASLQHSTTSSSTDLCNNLEEHHFSPNKIHEPLEEHRFINRSEPGSDLAVLDENYYNSNVKDSATTAAVSSSPHNSSVESTSSYLVTSDTGEERSDSGQNDSFFDRLAALEEGPLFVEDTEYFEASSEVFSEEEATIFLSQGAQVYENDSYFGAANNTDPREFFVSEESDSEDMGVAFSSNKKKPTSATSGAVRTTNNASCFPCPRVGRMARNSSGSSASTQKPLDNGGPSSPCASTSASATDARSSIHVVNASPAMGSTQRPSVLPPLSPSNATPLPGLRSNNSTRGVADVTLVERGEEDAVSVADEEVHGRDDGNVGAGGNSSSGPTPYVSWQLNTQYTAGLPDNDPRRRPNSSAGDACGHTTGARSSSGPIRPGLAAATASSSSTLPRPGALEGVSASGGLTPGNGSARNRGAAGGPNEDQAYLHDLEYAIQLSLELEYRRLSENDPEAVRRSEQEQKRVQEEEENQKSGKLRLTETEFPGGPQGSGSSDENESGVEKVVSCLICFEDYQAGDSVATLHCAGKHCFHKDCITKWLAKSGGECPMCKENVREEGGDGGGEASVNNAAGEAAEAA